MMVSIFLVGLVARVVAASAAVGTVPFTLLAEVLESAEGGVRHPSDDDDDSIRTWLQENAGNRRLEYCWSEGLQLSESAVLEPIRETLKSVADECGDLFSHIAGVRPPDFFITKYELVNLRRCLRYLVDNAETSLLTSAPFVDGVTQIISLAYNRHMDELVEENISQVVADGGFVMFRASLLELFRERPYRRIWLYGVILDTPKTPNWPPSALSIMDSSEISLSEAKAVLEEHIDFDKLEKEFMVEQEYTLSEAEEIWDTQSYVHDFPNWKRVIGDFFIGLYFSNKEDPQRLTHYRNCLTDSFEESEVVTIEGIFEFLENHTSTTQRIRIYKNFLNAVLDGRLTIPYEFTSQQTAERLVYLLRMTSNGFAYIAMGGYDV
jgi:hypothetical protein